MLSVATLLGVSTWRATASMRPDAPKTINVIAQTVPAGDAGGDPAVLHQEALLLGQSNTVGINTSGSASSTDPIAMIGPMVTAELAGQYAGLISAGSYSSTTAALAAGNVAETLKAAVSYKTYGLDDLKTDPDVSYQRMLTYRSDLRTALAPLLKNSASELELFAKYQETSDPTYLLQLKNAAVNYDAAIKLTTMMSIPRDAVNYHLSILNAMSEFSATIKAMADHGSDVLASAALLRTYNTAEADMYNSFNALGSYYSQKTP